MAVSVETIEEKIQQVIKQMAALRQENERLKTECESLKSHVAMLTEDNQKVQRSLAAAEQMRRAQGQASLRIERALQRLQAVTA